jgi:predicted permease
MLERWLRRLSYWLHSGDRARLLREEMETHLEMKAAELRDSGLTESEARDAARRQFGNLTMRQEESRDAWIARWLKDFIQDLQIAARTLRKQPGFAVVAVLSSALGIGTCSLIFAIANFALFRPLPVSEPSQLMSVTARNLVRGKIGQPLSYPDFEDIRQSHSFQSTSAIFQFMPVIISSNGEPKRYWGSVVTANYFQTVRPAFALGGGFDPARDDRKDGPPVVVLSNKMWLSRFNSDPGMIGRIIDLNNRKVNVIGVTGPGFQGTEGLFSCDLWLPFSMFDTLAEAAGLSRDRLQDRGAQWLLAAGRLRDGINANAALAEISVIGSRLQAAYPATNKNRGFHIEQAGLVNPGLRKLLVLCFFLLLGAAVLVLGASCANIANLLLARSLARQKEIATRLAISAGRWRLIRQLLTESMILALLGGAGGYALSYLGVRTAGQLRIPLALPVDFTISLDYRVILFCIALSGFTGVAFGLVPALRATRFDLVSALKEEHAQGGTARSFSLRNILIVAQVTISMVLLIGSGLFMRSLLSAYRIDPGFTQRALLLLAFDPNLNHYTTTETRQIVDTILERTGAISGVESACLTSSVPLSLAGTQGGFVPDDRVPDEENGFIPADIYSISPRFFETLGIRMLEGEDFRSGAVGEDIVIVNQAVADRAFPGQNPVGRRILYAGKMCRIIGLVATVKSRSIGEDPRPCLYLPIARNLRGNDSLTGINLVLRTRGNAAGYAPVVRQTIRGIDPTLSVFDIRTMESHLSQALFFPRAIAWLFGAVGLMGLLISTIGLYGVMSFTVARQGREIGIRMALGARRIQVIGMILRQGLLLTVIGSTIGTGLALGLSRVAASMLYGISPTDMATFSGVTLFLVLVASMASLVPALRAASIDPNHILKHE